MGMIKIDEPKCFQNSFKNHNSLQVIILFINLEMGS